MSRPVEMMQRPRDSQLELPSTIHKSCDGPAQPINDPLLNFAVLEAVWTSICIADRVLVKLPLACTYPTHPPRGTQDYRDSATHDADHGNQLFNNVFRGGRLQRRRELADHPAKQQEASGPTGM